MADRTHDGPHDGTHDDCFGCRIKGVGIAPSAMPSRQRIRRDANGNPVLRPMEDPSWEKGVAGERRPGGGFVPYLNEKGSPMRIKEHGEKRALVRENLQRLSQKG